jgi:hypothetical protein
MLMSVTPVSPAYKAHKKFVTAAVIWKPRNWFPIPLHPTWMCLVSNPRKVPRVDTQFKTRGSYETPHRGCKNRTQMEKEAILEIATDKHVYKLFAEVFVVWFLHTMKIL